MRCSCRECGTYMIHAESAHLGCVCPECGARCGDCLGTNTVIARDTLRRLREFEWFTPSSDEPAPGEENDADEENAPSAGFSQAAPVERPSRDRRID